MVYTPQKYFYIFQSRFILTVCFLLFFSGCSQLQFSSEVVKKIQHDGKDYQIHADKQDSLNFYGYYKVGNPYNIDGKTYYPQEYQEFNEEGIASWYGEAFHERPTANGAIFDMYKVSAAHRTLPLPSVIRVTNLTNGKVLDMVVNDRGPFAKDRILDISHRGAELLGYKEQGVTLVRIELLVDETSQLHQRLYGEDTKIANKNGTVDIDEPPLPSKAPTDDVVSNDLNPVNTISNIASATRDIARNSANNIANAASNAGSAASNAGSTIANTTSSVIQNTLNTASNLGNQAGNLISGFTPTSTSPSSVPNVPVPPVFQPQNVFRQTVAPASSSNINVPKAIVNEVANTINSNNLNVLPDGSANVVTLDTPEDIIGTDILDDNGQIFQSRLENGETLNLPSEKNNPQFTNNAKEQVTIQVGAFSSYENALQARALLSDIGDVGIEQLATSAGNPIFRVKVGQYVDAPTAQNALKTIQNSGYQDAIITAK